MGFMRDLTTSALFVLVMSGAPAAAQYPDKPITVVVPFAAGGPTTCRVR